MLIGVDASRVTRPRRTGTENYTLHVLREVLAGDARNRYRLYLADDLPAGLLPQAARPDVETRVIRLPRLWTQVGLSGEMLRRPPDVLYIPTHVLPLAHPPRSVVVVYDVGHRFFPRAHRLTEWLYLEWSIRRHVRVASRLITISEASKQDLVRLYGARPEHVAVAPPAADPSFRPRPPGEVARARAAYGLPERYVLVLGTVKPRKNLPRLVRAFARAALDPAVHLVVAGDVSFGLADLRRALDETRLHDRVRLLPYVDGADLPALYSGAACFAIPSLHEGFGIPALEALACGVPVVASDRSSLPEIVGDAGVLVDPLRVGSIAGGLERVLDDPALAARLREAGPVRAAAYRWADAGRVTLAVLEAAAATA